jgi:regulatory protein
MAGTITALHFQKRTAERVNVYLDGAYAFAVPATVAAALRRGQHLTDEDVARLQGLDAEQKAYDRALRFLAHRPRSTAETRRYLLGHDLAEPIVEAVIERLASSSYLDDEAFARFWVADRERFRPRGTAALRYELRLKGIADEVIAAALQAVDSQESAYRAAEGRARRLTGLDARSFRHKLGSYLLRRGFSHEVVWPVVDQLWQENHTGDSADDMTSGM